MAIAIGAFLGFCVFTVITVVIRGFFTVEQNERAVITSFGKAQRLPDVTTLDSPIADHLSEDYRQRYKYPQLKVIGPGGPYFKWPWQKVHKVDVAIRTVSLAWDPEDLAANSQGTILDAVTKDQLNIGITGQIRYKVAEENLYAFLFAVKNPIAHVMGYFVAILRERIANFEASTLDLETPEGVPDVVPETMGKIEGVSINDLRKNLNDLNTQMDDECLSSAARYGIVLDASLITGLDPPQEIESALAAINTAHNEVGADISIAQAMADQKIEQSKRAVEIETMRAEAEVQPLMRLAEQIAELKDSGPDALDAYVRNVKLGLFEKADRIVKTEN
ncbi:MAG: regulator of protease activity HflC (stomatin/prohibitin superfamily) [Verrucomicrobiales bacterium]|jgi:regulator of protease activity HflC (stomatin/prohibitin superfamily)